MNSLSGRMLLSAPAPYCLRTILWLAFSVVACYPPIAFARPTGELQRRQSNNGGTNTGVSANIWVRALSSCDAQRHAQTREPIHLVTNTDNCYRICRIDADRVYKTVHVQGARRRRHHKQ